MRCSENIASWIFILMIILMMINMSTSSPVNRTNTLKPSTMFKSEAQQMANDVPYGYGYLQPDNNQRTGYVGNILTSIFQIPIATLMAVSNLVQGILFNKYGGNNNNAPSNFGTNQLGNGAFGGLFGNNNNGAYAPNFGTNQLGNGAFGQLSAALQQGPPTILGTDNNV